MSYSILNKYKTEKNVDRTKFFNINNKIYNVSACYHLYSGVKTGKIYIYSEDFDFLYKKDFDYGILDIKYENGFFYTSNSDSSFSIIELDKNFELKEIKKVSIPSTDKDNTCNTLDISVNTILLAMNDGYHHIYDVEKDSIINSKKGHEYGLWSCYNYDENIYLTGSEDSLMKLYDKREKE